VPAEPAPAAARESGKDLWTPGTSAARAWLREPTQRRKLTKPVKGTPVGRALTIAVSRAKGEEPVRAHRPAGAEIRTANGWWEAWAAGYRGPPATAEAS
jgi:hypothetical protein